MSILPLSREKYQDHVNGIWHKALLLSQEEIIKRSECFLT